MEPERTKPYDEHERRVCDYIQELTGGVVGCGNDPIGFLIAAHNSLSVVNQQLREELHVLRHEGWPKEE